jgi:hypothetical protein
MNKGYTSFYLTPSPSPPKESFGQRRGGVDVLFYFIQFIPSCGKPFAAQFLPHFPVSLQSGSNIFDHIIPLAEIDIVNHLHQLPLVTFIVI